MPIIGFRIECLHLLFFAVASWALTKGLKLNVDIAGIGLFEIVFGVMFGVVFFYERPGPLVFSWHRYIITLAAAMLYLKTTV